LKILVVRSVLYYLPFATKQNPCCGSVGANYGKDAAKESPGGKRRECGSDRRREFSQLLVVRQPVAYFCSKNKDAYLSMMGYRDDVIT
jgi:hypothetical protein